MLRVRTDKHPLACSQAIGLDHTGAHNGCVCIRSVRVNAIGRGGDAVLGHEVLGKGLAGLQLRGQSNGTKNRDPQLTAAVRQAIGQGRLRAHHHQINTYLVGLAGQLARRQPASLGRKTRIVVCHPDARDARALRELPSQRGLAATTTYDQNLHWDSRAKARQCPCA